MRLYNVFPRESVFNWPNKEGINRLVTMTGQWLGTAGKSTKPTFVPIFVAEKEPDEYKWGVQATETKRPKIVSNSDTTPGVIAVLSSFNGDGREVGRVFVHEDDLENVEVIAYGIGGSEALALLYHEYLVKVTGEAKFLVMPTSRPYYTLTLTPTSETITSLSAVPNLLTDYVALDDQSVPKWRRADE